MKKKVLVFGVSLLFSVGVLLAQPGGPGGPPEPEDPPVGIPIDGGSLGLFVIGMGIIFSSLYINKKREKKMDIQ